MDIQYLGHSSFRLKGKNATLVTDPYDESVGFKFPKVSADIVTISHGHDDHSKADLVQDVRHVFSGPGEYETQDVSIIGFPSFHDDKKGELRGKNTMFVIEMDGVRIAHLGDLGHKLTEKTLDKMGEIDVLFIPVGGHYTIGPEEAVSVAQSFESNIIIPMHYQMPELNKEIYKDLVNADEFVTKLGLSVKKESKLSVKAGTIDEEQQIVILEKK